jgi:hypothetical protein
MTMTYKDTFTYTDQHFVEHDVNGKLIKFFPNRYALLGDLAKISKPMASALTTIFMEEARETTATNKSMKDAEGMEMSEITVSAISPELAAHKSKERRDSIEALISSIEEPNNRILLGKLLMDSMRDEFQYKRDRTPKDVLAWLEGDETGEYHGIDLPVLTQLIGGWIKANSKVFGEQGEQLVGAMKDRLRILRENYPSPETTKTETPGGISKTA